MNQFEEIAENVRKHLDACTAARDRALSQTRLLTRYCANAIRAIHRDERLVAEEHLAKAQELVAGIKSDLTEDPDLYFAGYTQDALKEYAEAKIVFALALDHDLPSPEQLGVEPATYLQGLAEACGELRRRSLDQIRQGCSAEAERLLGLMDDIFTVLTSMDYPDAVTGGLRRLTDIARSIIERTRGDLTITLRQEHLEAKLNRLEERLKAER
jgi:translin